MIKFIKLIKWVILVFVIVQISACAPPKTSIVFINRVHDGDTFSHKNTTYRLYGVDTPEMSKPPFWNKTQGIEYEYALKATNYVKQKILNHFVCVEKMGPKTYGRFVAKIMINHQDLALSLIKKGLARMAYINITNKNSNYYSTDKSYYFQLSKAQNIAKINHIGFWSMVGQFSKIFPKA